jgi:hypothetical protein
MEFIPDILNILSTVGIVNGLRLPAAGHHRLICRPVSPPALRSCPAILGAQAPVISSFSGPYPSGAYDFYQVHYRPFFPDRHNSSPCPVPGAGGLAFSSEN